MKVLIKYVRNFKERLLAKKKLKERLERSIEEGRKLIEEDRRKWKREEKLLSSIESIAEKCTENISKSLNSQKLWEVIRQINHLTTDFIIALKDGTDNDRKEVDSQRDLFFQENKSELNELRIHLQSLIDIVKEAETLHCDWKLIHKVRIDLLRVCSFLTTAK